MASLGNACRLTARLASSQLCSHATSRGFRTASASLAAHNFTMPAMSPTMTEGNISSWKVKEGDNFSAGDILLEIETDKAQMEVEAQDDGIMAKITQGDGSKAVKVGSRIGVLADIGDDLSSLEIPAEETSKQSSPPAKHEASPTQTTSKEAPAKLKEVGNMPPSAGNPKKQTYPLYPSVQHTLLQNGLSKEEADKIPASGPNGRLLKGDVLAYLGQIDKSYPAKVSSRITKLGHLDLSNIKIAEPPAKKEAAPASEAKPTQELPVEFSLPISLTAVLQAQQRVQTSLGINLPTTTFIARAIELANDSLPLPKGRTPTSDELFNSVLGLDHLSPTRSIGSFTPQITPFGLPAPRQTKKKVDLYDEILGSKRKSTIRSATLASASTVPAEPISVFSITAPKGDEKRARVFLERMKTVLEVDPGRLVL